jgi:hypothetical protein
MPGVGQYNVGRTREDVRKISIAELERDSPRSDGVLEGIRQDCENLDGALAPDEPLRAMVGIRDLDPLTTGGKAVETKAL